MKQTKSPAINLIVTIYNALCCSWQLLLGSMGIMIMLIVIAACCCQCCTLKTGGWQRATGSRGRRADRSKYQLIKA